MGPGGHEQEVTSAIRAMVFQRLSEAAHRVALVHTELSNRERVQFVESIHASVYLSIECSTDPRPGWTALDGMTITTGRPSESVARELSSALGALVPIRLRGGTGIEYNDDLFLVKRLPGVHVLRVSCGYLSNRADMDVLTSTDGRKRIALALAAGVFPWAN